MRNNEKTESINSASSSNSPSLQRETSPSTIESFRPSHYSSVSNYDLTEHEKSYLNTLVFQYKRDWKRITPLFEKNTKKHIPKHALKTLFKDIQTPKVTRKWYSKSEDDLILETVAKFGRNWVKVAEMIPYRDPFSLRDRYKTLSKQIKDPMSSDSRNLDLLVCDIELDCIPKFLVTIESMMRNIGKF